MVTVDVCQQDKLQIPDVWFNHPVGDSTIDQHSLSDDDRVPL